MRKKRRREKPVERERPVEISAEARLEYCLSLVQTATARAQLETAAEHLESLGLRLADRITSGREFASDEERVKVALAEAFATLEAIGADAAKGA